MASNFPTSLDTFTNPTSADALDSVSVPHATQHSDLNDAVEALQAKVGADGSAVVSSHDYKIAQLEAASTGKILQVLQTVKTDTFTTTSTSFVDVTGVSQAITPSSSSNKVLITVTGIAGNSGGNGTFFNLVRDSTDIGVSTGGATYNQTQVVYTNDTSASQAFSISFLDSPSTTSAATYKLQMKVTGNTGAVGRNANNANSGAITTITLMEVSA